MALIFHNGRNPSTRLEVQAAMSIIEQEPSAFILISRVFNIKRNSTDQLQYLAEVDKVIEATLNSPRHVLDETLKSQLRTLLQSIYRNKKFDKIKSEILETVVYKYGPYTENLIREKVYMEPTIKDEDVLVGNQSKIDSVFFLNETTPLEFVECKANIANVIPSNLPIHRLSRGDRKKVDYLEKAYNYLSDRFCSPEIYLACYNSNYDDQLENVHQNWGLRFFKFLNPEELYNSIVQYP